MKVELFSFQKEAVENLRMWVYESQGAFRRTHVPQVISFTAPTGAGKTIVMASLIEEIFNGDDSHADERDAVFVWLSDSPELNLQSKAKIDLKADRIRLGQCVVIEDESFDREELEDGHVYFLNTQKLGKSSNLTKHSDGRQYTIWETLQNTIVNKPDRLYFIIDEAHRGASGNAAATATTIMQKFIKGSPENGLSSMPIVIGMSATPERFNALVKGYTNSSIHNVVVTPDDVRKSGLLKDRIIITHPEDDKVTNEMSILQAAVDEWQHKCAHWHQYLVEQHYAVFNPVLVIQVLDGTAGKVSETPLEDYLRKIEERVGRTFDAGEVVQTFDTKSAIDVGGYQMQYIEPSRIAETKNVKVVFFKQNLSTGWDCPRAETMMSVRRAKDSTHIAQLLGRMVRTPTQQRIQVDDSLNDVHLYLPYFDSETVKAIVKDLQDREGGELPTEIESERFDDGPAQILQIKPKRIVQKPVVIPVVIEEKSSPKQPAAPEVKMPVQETSVKESTAEYNVAKDAAAKNAPKEATSKKEESVFVPVEEEVVLEDGIDRESVVKFINDSEFDTFNVRSVRISKNHVSSLFALVQVLVMTDIWRDGLRTVKTEIVDLIRDYADGLRKSGKYEQLSKDITEFKLSSEIFDVYGISIQDEVQGSIATAQSDIDRIFKLADKKLGETGIGNFYITSSSKTDADWENPEFKVDVILFAADSECLRKLDDYASKRFNEIDDAYRRKVNLLKGADEKFKKEYNDIVSNSAEVTKHVFGLPETIMGTDRDGEKFEKHLFVDDHGFAKFKLNNWEKKTLAEEFAREDFVTWYRNPPRKSFSLAIPYEKDNQIKAMYPDFIIVRKDGDSYVADMLEPHNPELGDNLGKAKAFAKYAEECALFGRIQLIRVNGEHVKRLEFTKRDIRERVMLCNNLEDLNRVFGDCAVEE